MNYDLFFSYSRSSIDIAFSLINKLEEYGLYLWFDRNDVLLGCDIWQNISCVLEEARKWIGMIVLIDSEYLSKNWCTMEINYALSHNICLFPVFYRFEKEDLPSGFASLKNYNIVTIRNSSDIVNAIDRLIDSIISKITVSLIVDTDSDIFTGLYNSYINLPRTNPDKIICADNIVHYLEITHNNQFDHFERFIANVVHQKTRQLFCADTAHLYDIKIVCHALEKLLNSKSIQ